MLFFYPCQAPGSPLFFAGEHSQLVNQYDSTLWEPD
ncbi:hypothetical protein BOTU111921_13630 [Bordetella tumbae]